MDAMIFYTIFYASDTMLCAKRSSSSSMPNRLSSSLWCGLPVGSSWIFPTSIHCWSCFSPLRGGSIIAHSRGTFRTIAFVVTGSLTNSEYGLQCLCRKWYLLAPFANAVESLALDQECALAVWGADGNSVTFKVHYTNRLFKGLVVQWRKTISRIAQKVN